MSLRLYLDESAYSKRLANLLRGEPWRHEVETPVEADLIGASDPEVLAYARRRRLILITKNPLDFALLHEADQAHSGIFAIYQDNRPTDMSARDIAEAVNNIERAEIPCAASFYVLNAWVY